jgi:membrane associated rhomboid family serine protease
MTPAWQEWKESLHKLPGSDYGYHRDGKLYTCSREELVEVCRNGNTELVWTPDSSSLQVTEEVPFLFDVHKGRAIRGAWWGIGGWLAIFLLLFMVVIFGEDLPSPGSAGFFYVSIPLLGLVWSARALSQAHKLTPEEVASSAPRSWYFLWLGKQSCPNTWLLIGGIAFVALMQLVASDSIASAGLSRAKVLEGEVWRLVTAPMLHARPSHLYWNLTSLFVLGRILEAHGRQRWIVAVFTVSALVGGIFSIALPPDKISIGASGGILGLGGFLGVLAWRNKRELPPGFLKSLLAGLGFTAAIGLVGFQFIDNAAHLGGLLAGMGLGAWLISPEEGRYRAPA